MTKKHKDKFGDMIAAISNKNKAEIILACLDEPKSVASLARSLGISISLCLFHVDALEDAGFVKTKKNTSGYRNTMVSSIKNKEVRAIIEARNTILTAIK